MNSIAEMTTQFAGSVRKAAESIQELNEALQGPRQPVSARQARRSAARHDGRLAKKATRNHRRSAIDGLQNQQTALGLARVYLGGAGNAAMQKNVSRHIDALSTALARQEHPELFVENTDHLELDRAAAEYDALGQIVVRLQEVLDAHAV